MAKSMVLVSGTFSCASNGNVFDSGVLVVNLTQAFSQIVQGTGSTTLAPCDQGVVPYTVVVTPSGSTPFKRGPAVATATLTLSFNFGGTIFAVSTGNQTFRING